MAAHDERTMTPDQGTWIDMQLLGRNTFDDRALRDEVLRLFHQQSQELIARLQQDLPSQEWRALAHKLKGSALGIGAGQLARLAAEAEGGANQSDAIWRTHLAAQLMTAVQATNHEIETLLT